MPAARSVDVDAHRPVAKSFGVRSVPFVTLLRRGAWFAWDDAAGEPVPLPAARFEGALAADAVADWLNNRRAAVARRAGLLALTRGPAARGWRCACRRTWRSSRRRRCLRRSATRRVTS